MQNLLFANKENTPSPHSIHFFTFFFQNNHTLCGRSTHPLLLRSVVVVRHLQHTQVEDEEDPLTDNLEPHGLAAGGRTRSAALL